MLKPVWNACRKSINGNITNKYQSFPTTLKKSQKPCRVKTNTIAIIRIASNLVLKTIVKKLVI